MDDRAEGKSGEEKNMPGRLLIFAKYPRAGNVKTRLVPPLTDQEAADLYAAMLCDSLQAYRELPAIEPLLFVADGEDLEPMRRLLRDQGVISEDTDSQMPMFAQKGRDLGERLMNAFADTFACGSGPVAVIGTDHPSLPVEYIRRMFEELNDHDLVLGPADDGGYYTMGLRAEEPELFREMPWSTPELFARTMEIARIRELRTSVLPEWYDVDDGRTLRRLIEDMEKGRVGSRVRRILSDAVYTGEFFLSAAGNSGPDELKEERG